MSDDNSHGNTLMSPEQQMCVDAGLCVLTCLQMPQLKPETISMTGLNLFQHLCNLARLATSALDNASSCEVIRLLSASFLPAKKYLKQKCVYELTGRPFRT